MSSTHDNDGHHAPHRRTSETKDSLKTTELMAYVASVLAVALAALMVGADEGSNGNDPFGALDAMRLITWLTVGYMVSRGLAKAGSRAKYRD